MAHMADFSTIAGHYDTTQGIMPGGCVQDPHHPHDFHHHTEPVVIPPVAPAKSDDHGPYYLGEVNGHPVYGGLIIPHGPTVIDNGTFGGTPNWVW